jgi:hypothetical protein
MEKAKILWYIKEIVADVLLFIMMWMLIIFLLGVAPI